MLRIDWTSFPQTRRVATATQVAVMVNQSKDRDYIFSLNRPLSVLARDDFWTPARLEQLTERGRDELYDWMQEYRSHDKMTPESRSPVAERRGAAKCAHCLDKPAGFPEAPNSVFCSPRCRQHQRASRASPGFQGGFGPIRQLPPQIVQQLAEYLSNHPASEPASSLQMQRSSHPLGSLPSAPVERELSPAPFRTLLPTQPPSVPPTQPGFLPSSGVSPVSQSTQPSSNPATVSPDAEITPSSSPDSVESEDGGDQDPYDKALGEFVDRLTVANLRILMSAKRIPLLISTKSPLKPERVASVIAWYRDNSTWDSFKQDLIRINVFLKDIDSVILPQ